MWDCKHKPHCPLEPVNLEVSPRKQLQKLRLQMCAQTPFWKIPVSFREAGEECKDGILWPTLPGSTSVGSRCVLRLKLQDQQQKGWESVSVCC